MPDKTRDEFLLPRPYFFQRFDPSNPGTPNLCFLCSLLFKILLTHPPSLPRIRFEQEATEGTEKEERVFISPSLFLPALRSPEPGNTQPLFPLFPPVQNPPDAPSGLAPDSNCAGGNGERGKSLYFPIPISSSAPITRIPGTPNLCYLRSLLFKILRRFSTSLPRIRFEQEATEGTEKEERDFIPPSLFLPALRSPEPGNPQPLFPLFPPVQNRPDAPSGLAPDSIWTGGNGGNGERGKSLYFPIPISSSASIPRTREHPISVSSVPSCSKSSARARILASERK